MINKRTMSGEENNATIGFDGEKTNFAAEEKNVENSVNESEIGEEGKEAILKENMADLEKLYDDRSVKMREIFTEAEKDINIGGLGIGRIEKSGVSIKGGGVVKADSGLRRDLSGDLRHIRGEMDSLEKKALDIPENLEGETEKIPEFKKEIPKAVRDYQNKTEKLLEKLEREREKFVKEFIEESIKDVLNHFEADINGTKNKINAKEIISLKIRKEIGFAAERFIKTGDKADFGFTATLKVSSYKQAKEEKKFVTGFIIKIGGYEKKIRENDSPQGNRLMPGSEIVKRDNARREGARIKEENVR